jgi:hypothetical protein
MEKNITLNDFKNLKLNIANILNEDINEVNIEYKKNITNTISYYDKVKLIIKILLSFKEEEKIGLKELKLIKNNIIDILNEDEKKINNIIKLFDKEFYKCCNKHNFIVDSIDIDLDFSKTIIYCCICNMNKDI